MIRTVISARSSSVSKRLVCLFLSIVLVADTCPAPALAVGGTPPFFTSPSFDEQALSALASQFRSRFNTQPTAVTWKTVGAVAQETAMSPRSLQRSIRVARFFGLGLPALAALYNALNLHFIPFRFDDDFTWAFICAYLALESAAIWMEFVWWWGNRLPAPDDSTLRPNVPFAKTVLHKAAEFITLRGNRWGVNPNVGAVASWTGRGWKKIPVRVLRLFGFDVPYWGFGAPGHEAGHSLGLVSEGWTYMLTQFVPMAFGFMGASHVYQALTGIPIFTVGTLVAGLVGQFGLTALVSLGLVRFASSHTGRREAFRFSVWVAGQLRRQIPFRILRSLAFMVRHDADLKAEVAAYPFRFPPTQITQLITHLDPSIEALSQLDGVNIAKVRSGRLETRLALRVGGTQNPVWVLNLVFVPPMWDPRPAFIVGQCCFRYRPNDYLDIQSFAVAPRYYEEAFHAGILRLLVGSLPDVRYILHAPDRSLIAAIYSNLPQEFWWSPRPGGRKLNAREALTYFEHEARQHSYGRPALYRGWLPWHRYRPLYFQPDLSPSLPPSVIREFEAKVFGPIMDLYGNVGEDSFPPSVSASIEAALEQTPFGKAIHRVKKQPVSVTFNFTDRIDIRANLKPGEETVSTAETLNPSGDIPEWLQIHWQRGDFRHVDPTNPMEQERFESTERSGRAIDWRFVQEFERRFRRVRGSRIHPPMSIMRQVSRRSRARSLVGDMVDPLVDFLVKRFDLHAGWTEQIEQRFAQFFLTRNPVSLLSEGKRRVHLARFEALWDWYPEASQPPHETSDIQAHWAAELIDVNNIPADVVTSWIRRASLARAPTSVEVSFPRGYVSLVSEIVAETPQHFSDPNAVVRLAGLLVGRTDHALQRYFQFLIGYDVFVWPDDWIRAGGIEPSTVHIPRERYFRAGTAALEHWNVQSGEQPKVPVQEPSIGWHWSLFLFAADYFEWLIRDDLVLAYIARVLYWDFSITDGDIKEKYKARERRWNRFQPPWEGRPSNEKRWLTAIAGSIVQGHVRVRIEGDIGKNWKYELTGLSSEEMRALAKEPRTRERPESGWFTLWLLFGAIELLSQFQSPSRPTLPRALEAAS